MVKVTQNQSNVVHAAYVNSDGNVAGTDCNREVWTISNKRRVFYRTEADVTCRKCRRINHL